MATQKPWLIVEPAYWRVYLTNEAMRKDWDEGKDFRIENFGPYMSRRDLDKNTMDIKTEYAGIQIVQAKTYHTLADKRLLRIPFLTVEITW